MASPETLIVTIVEPAVFLSAVDNRSEFNLESGAELPISIPSQISQEVALKV